MKATSTKVILIVPLLLFAVTVGLLLSMGKIDRQTEPATTFYTATVTDVAVTDTGKDVSAEIHTEEFSTALYLSTNVCKAIGIDDLEGLKHGQTIVFGIENSQVPQMNEVEFVDITALKTDTDEMLSLAEYNRCMERPVFPARIAGGVMAALFLVVALACGVKIRRDK